MPWHCYPKNLWGYVDVSHRLKSINKYMLPPGMVKGLGIIKNIRTKKLQILWGLALYFLITSIETE